MTIKIKGKDLITLRHHYSQHHKRQEWLYRYANISEIEDFDQEGDDIIIKVAIDPIIHQQYLKTFENDRFEQGKSRGSMTPPKDW